MKAGFFRAPEVVIPSAYHVARGKPIEHEGPQYLTCEPNQTLRSFAASLPNLYKIPRAQDDNFSVCVIKKSESYKPFRKAPYVVIPSAYHVARSKTLQHEGSQNLTYNPNQTLISFAVTLPNLSKILRAQDDNFGELQEASNTLNSCMLCTTTFFMNTNP